MGGKGSGAWAVHRRGVDVDVDHSVGPLRATCCTYVVRGAFNAWRRPGSPGLTTLASCRAQVGQRPPYYRQLKVSLWLASFHG